MSYAKVYGFTKKPGLQLVAYLKNMAMMDIAERRASQDGKILRRFEETNLNSAVQQYPENMEKKWYLGS